MAKVLNGEVQAGDRVAYATRHGSWMDMHIATVLAEVDGALQVEVTQGTGWRDREPRKTTIYVLDRVVKL